MIDRNELLGITIRVVAAAAVSFFSLRYLVKHIDPNDSINEECKKKVAKLFQELGIDREVELSEHEVRIATQFVGGEEVGADWDEIGGCEELVAELKDRIILPLRFAAESGSHLLSPPRGILLYGPPGCGKTLLAKAVARAAGCRFINLQISNLTDKWYGESQKLAAAVFSVAQKFQPTIIFIDEVDSFLRDRQSHDHESTAMMKAQFMTLWDGFASSGDQIIVMGATNRPRDVDSAILRRMTARFQVPVPDARQRSQILDVILRNERIKGDVNLEKIAQTAEGLSGSDLKEVCRLALLARAKATVASGGSVTRLLPLEQSDFESAVHKYMRAAQLLVEETLD
ncbi:CBN-MSPN-1 protein [Caenorhabditis brenneri]|uniref:CBN-MSPN-1 protein n=1 Tax=Caenorhabditis brenneri TaxID=135651 RepID=G0NUR0_CAEBE|nr:CBN-MSPN-1 protein [Caenorhabditis brenneri]